MSAQFVVLCAGVALKWGNGMIHPSTPETATVFTSVADAWYAAYRAGLSPNHLEVVSRDEALAGTRRKDAGAPSGQSLLTSAATNLCN